MNNKNVSLINICQEFLIAENIELPSIKDMNTIPKGDMPGDKIEIDVNHIQKAATILPELMELLSSKFEDSNKLILSVHGGSGVGKSEIGSLLAFYLNDLGIGSYILSGDNYPNRIPKYNDAERLRMYRTAGVKALSEKGLLSQEVKEIILQLQRDDNDADITLVQEYSWLRVYQKAGRDNLNSYLGSSAEIDFEEINSIISSFKESKSSMMLKRMGRSESELWYDQVNMTDISVLVIEWTHGNNKNLKGVDIPILLNSTPEETLEHRRLRNRDGGLDSPFTMMVLDLEQKKLDTQAESAKVIVTKAGKLIAYDEYTRLGKNKEIDYGPMLNAYPDSIGSDLSDMISFLDHTDLENVFSSFYVLPSIFNTDLDRGFSVIDYGINELYASEEEIDSLRSKNIDLKFDIILNHASVLSKEFQDILKNGRDSKYIDFFIDWNKFWDGYGEITPEGYIQPEESVIEDMFFRKPGLPILNVRMPDGSDLPFWNTFYQEINYNNVNEQELMNVVDIQYGSAKVLAEIINTSIEKGEKPNDIKFGRFNKYRLAIIDLLETKRTYLGQMDLNIKSPLVWEFYEDTMKKLSDYGAKIVRLDAFAYTSKEPGEKNFFNEPGTWDILDKINHLAKKHDLTLLPEIHSRYEEGIHEQISNKGYMTYDFFLPGLIIDAFERQTFDVLSTWIQEIIDKDLKMVNMLGCHDGIPLLDLKGLLSDQQIENIIDVVVGRGGLVKDLHGKKNIYYQVNATYYSALGEDDKKMLLARAIQIFMPGKPQVWYLDLFAGKNDHEAVKQAGISGHKEINRTNLSLENIAEYMNQEVVVEQLNLLKFRNSHLAFKDEPIISVKHNVSDALTITWENGKHKATLNANLSKFSYDIIVEE